MQNNRVNQPELVNHNLKLALKPKPRSRLILGNNHNPVNRHRFARTPNHRPNNLSTNSKNLSQLVLK